LLDTYEKFERNMLDKGAISVNVEEPLDNVVASILSKLN